MYLKYLNYFFTFYSLFQIQGARRPQLNSARPGDRGLGAPWQAIHRGPPIQPPPASLLVSPLTSTHFSTFPLQPYNGAPWRPWGPHGRCWGPMEGPRYLSDPREPNLQALELKGPPYKVFQRFKYIVWGCFSSGAPPLRVFECWSFNPLDLGPSKSQNCTIRSPQIS